MNKRIHAWGAGKVKMSAGGNRILTWNAKMTGVGVNLSFLFLGKVLAVFSSLVFSL